MATNESPKKRLVSAWFRRVLERLAEEVPLETFDDGDPDRFCDAVFEDEKESGLYDATRSICASFLQCCVEQFDLHDILNGFFPWYGLGQCPRDEDRLNFICSLLYERVLIGVLKMDDFLRIDPEDVVAEEGYSPVLQTHYSNDVGLPLSFLPLRCVFMLDEPPKFGAIDTQECSIQHDDDDSVVRVFISHRWASPSNPSLDGDWHRLRLCLLEVVENINLVHTMLQRNGFPIKEVIREAQSIGFKRFFGTWTLIGMEWPDHLLDGLEGEGTEENDPLVSLVSGDMASHIFYLCCHQWIIQPDGRKPDVTLTLLDQIWLWYDFCSLPQTPDRTPQQHDLFKKSLAKLPQIQQSMYSLSLNTDTSYFQRAWCVSEWMSATAGGSLFNYHLGGDGVIDEAAASAFRWLKICQSAVALIQPCLQASVVLHSLGLRFTDEEHSDNATTICWILMEVLVKRSYLFFAAGWRDSQFQGNDLLIGVGSLQTIHAWLHLWRDVVGHKEINRDDWIEQRAAMASNVIEDLQKRQRIDIDVSGEDSYDASNLLEALDKGLAGLAKVEPGNNAAGYALYFAMN